MLDNNKMRTIALLILFFCGFFREGQSIDTKTEPTENLFQHTKQAAIFFDAGDNPETIKIYNE